MQGEARGGRLSRRAVVGSLVGCGVSAAGLVTLNACALLPSPTPSAKVPRIGYLGEPPDSPWVAGLWDGLGELGWVAGQTVGVERRSDLGLGQSELAAVAAELV